MPDDTRSPFLAVRKMGSGPPARSAQSVRTSRPREGRRSRWGVGIGREIARRLVERGDKVFLLGVGDADLERSSSDLTTRHPRREAMLHAMPILERTRTVRGSARQGGRRARRLRHRRRDGGDVCIARGARGGYRAHASSRDRELRKHGRVPCEFTSRCSRAVVGGFHVFSSVAGDRGRKPVAIYGVDQRRLSVYLEAMDHKFHAAGLRPRWRARLQKTGMTASPEAAAVCGRAGPGEQPPTERWMSGSR